jgi:hypothetical protein
MDGSTEGVWYDPSDIKLNWRRNLLTYSEQFDNAVWGRIDVGGTPVSVAVSPYSSPIGSTAYQVFGLDTVNDRVDYSTSILATAGSTYTYSVWLRGSGTVKIELNTTTGLGGAGEYTVVLTGAWVRYSISTTYTAAVTGNVRAHAVITRTTGIAPDVHIWGAQLELGSTVTEYQKITDGVSDYLTYQPLPILYQDAAGTTPVTAVEQPVGLMLDKSKGLVLGPELVTNGDFSNGTTGWSVYSGSSGGVISNSSGSLLVSNNGGTYTRGVTALTGLVVGKWYKVTGDCLTSSNGAVVRIATESTAASGYVYNNIALAVGVISFQFAATATTLYLAVGIESNVTTAVASFDNISVRELPGNHAYQTVSTRRPVLTARYNLLQNTEVLITQSRTVRAFKHVVSFYGTGTITLSGAATGTLVGTGTNDRVYLEFTPTAGTLTLTVSGSVTKAQLEEV